MKRKPAGAASAPYLSAMFFASLVNWRPKQAAASELIGQCAAPAVSVKCRGNRAQALRSMSPTNIGAVLREVEGPLKIAC